MYNLYANVHLVLLKSKLNRFHLKQQSQRVWFVRDFSSFAIFTIACFNGLFCAPCKQKRPVFFKKYNPDAIDPHSIFGIVADVVFILNNRGIIII